MEKLFINEEGILHLLNNLDLKKSTGPDSIPNAFLNRYAAWISKYLLIIFRVSLETSSIPDDWRRAKIIPVLKSGSKFEPSNYRPVSLTSTCCKVMEHIIFKSIISYLERNNLIYNQQHGFRSGLSTLTQLAEITNDLANAINTNSQVDAIFLDFSKAFDLVPHEDLITKLKAFGIDDTLISWISSFLQNRTQCVAVNTHTSDSLHVYSGVPQGSVLAPLLFLIYINDIQFCIQSPIQMRLFADDCVVYTVVRHSEDQIGLNNSLKNISDWCQKWGMRLNASKTKCLTFTNKKHPLNFSYTLENNELPKSDQVKYLGVTLSANLSWEPHIDTVCKKALRKLSFLRRRLRNAPTQVKLNAYKTLIRPALEYADIIWSPHQQHLIDKIERIQKLAVRFIYSNYSRHSSVTDLINRANLQPLSKRRIISRLKFLYLLYHGHFKIPRTLYLQDPFKHSLRTNHNKVIFQPASRANTHKYSLFPMAICFWNKLPVNAVNCSTLESFVKCLEEIDFF